MALFGIAQLAGFFVLPRTNCLKKNDNSPGNIYSGFRIVKFAVLFDARQTTFFESG
jgi:hypothetical protein